MTLRHAATLHDNLGYYGHSVTVSNGFSAVAPLGNPVFRDACTLSGQLRFSVCPLAIVHYNRFQGRQLPSGESLIPSGQPWTQAVGRFLVGVDISPMGTGVQAV